MADDVAADKTPGFKVGEKKTLDEYHTLGKSHFDFVSTFWLAGSITMHFVKVNRLSYVQYSLL